MDLPVPRKVVPLVWHFRCRKKRVGAPRAAKKGRFFYGLLIGSSIDCDEVSEPNFGKAVDKAIEERLFDHFWSNLRCGTTTWGPKIDITAVLSLFKTDGSKI